MKKSQKQGVSDKSKAVPVGVQIPQAPKHLQQDGVDMWRILWREFTIPPEAVGILEVCCTALDRATQARKIIESEGLVTYDRFNQSKAHPLCAVERDAMSLFLKSFKQLNLSEPVSEIQERLRIAKARS